MEKNINPEINRLNMETSRNAADSLREWAGLGSEKKPVAVGGMATVAWDAFSPSTLRLLGAATLGRD